MGSAIRAPLRIEGLSRSRAFTSALTGLLWPCHAPLSHLHSVAIHFSLRLSIITFYQEIATRLGPMAHPYETCCTHLVVPTLIPYEQSYRGNMSSLHLSGPNTQREREILLRARPGCTHTRLQRSMNVLPLSPRTHALSGVDAPCASLPPPRQCTCLLDVLSSLVPDTLCKGASTLLARSASLSRLVCLMSWTRAPVKCGSPTLEPFWNARPTCYTLS